MVNTKEIFLSISIIAASAVILFGSGAVALPGSTQLPSFADLIGGSSENARYKVSTEIDVRASASGGSIREASFDYDTQKCVICSLSFADSSPALAWGGLNQAELQLEVYDSGNRKLVDTSKFLGEIGALQRETVKFSFSNVPKGDYRLVYTFTAKGDAIGTPIEKSVTKNIRVPETAQSIG